MKTMTCAQMGGPCEACMTAGSEQEMVAAGWKHLEEAHTDLMETMKNMSQEEKDAWAAEFHTKWEAAPEDTEAETETEAEAATAV